MQAALAGPLKGQLGGKSEELLALIKGDKKNIPLFLEKMKAVTIERGISEAEYEKLTQMLTNTLNNVDMTKMNGLLVAIMTGQPDQIREKFLEMQGAKEIMNVLEGGDGEGGGDAGRVEQAEQAEQAEEGGENLGLDDA